MQLPLRPDRVREAMDADMRAVWEKADGLPHEVRLYGGTALALYLGHRRSQDFDFVHTDWQINLPYVHKHMAPFNEGVLRGGEGSVDVTIRGAKRIIMANFMEAGGSFVPFAEREPVIASNGVAVAHLDDLMASKLRALMNRDEAKDYIDTAACIRAAPEAVMNGIAILDEQGEHIYRLIRAMGAPAPSAREGCSKAELDTVADFAVDYMTSTVPAHWQEKASIEWEPIHTSAQQ